ncbi:MAG: DUF350 domain-containing protein [Deltaproteobacteria bacterium]|nr:DUF350 domain-containing protein [Deltaproteobacteria bacterium]
MHFDTLTTVLLPAATALTLALLVGARKLAQRPPASVDNPAMLSVLGGEVLAACMIGGAAAAVGGANWPDRVIWAATTATLGAAAQLGAVGVSLRWFLGRDVAEELGKGNAAVGLAAAGYDIAVGRVVSSSLVGGDRGDLVPGLAFYGLGITALLLLTSLLRALTPFDDAQQLRSGNLAVALAHAGMTLAVALLVSHATAGTFDGWGVSLRAFTETIAFAAVLVPIRVGVVQAALLRQGWQWRGGALDRLVGEQRHLGAAALEAAALIGGALAVRAVVG